MRAARGPWTPAEQARIVRRAIAFIRARIHLHDFRFAMEVGGHLFRGLFKGDRRLLESGGEWKTESLRSIAADERVEMNEKQLSDCVHAYLAVTAFRKQASDVVLPELTPWQWAKIDVPLAGDPAALVALARWEEREKIPSDFVAAAARLVRPYVEAGGKLEDLMVSGDAPESPYGRIMRVAGVMERWLDTHEIAREARERAIAAIDGALAGLRA